MGTRKEEPSNNEDQERKIISTAFTKRPEKMFQTNDLARISLDVRAKQKTNTTPRHDFSIPTDTATHTIDPDQYQKIHSALVTEFGENNIVSVILFGSIVGNNSKLYSDYDFCIILRELSDDINVREAASPRLKRKLREIDVPTLCAFNLYTQDEFTKASDQGSWLIETIKNHHEELFDSDGYTKSVLSQKNPSIEKIDTFSWKGIQIENPIVFIDYANRHLECARLLMDTDPELAAYHQMEAKRGFLIAKLYRHGIYDTRSSALSLAIKLNQTFGEKNDVHLLQTENLKLETIWKKAIYDYNSVERNLKAAEILDNQGYHQEALFHTYSALKNVYLKIMHYHNVFTFDGEITQIFLKEFGHSIPKKLLDELYAFSFKAEQLLGRSGYSSFDLDHQGKPRYLDSKIDSNIVFKVSSSLRRLIPHIQDLELLNNKNEDNDTKPLISIVIATYNRPSYLLECIDSLNGLIIPTDKIEVVVVNDGSRMQYDFEKIISRSRYNIRIINKPHSGICATKNKGIEESRGEYVAFLDDDMFASPFWLTSLMSGFRDSTIAGVGSTNLTYPSDSQLSQYSDYRELLRAPFRDKSGQILNVITCSAVIKKNILVQVDGFNKKQSELGVSFGGDDVDLTWKIRQLGYKFNHVKDAICFHNHRSNFRSFIKQHIGYGEGTMFHCIDKNRNPAELGIPDPNLTSVTKDLIKYLTNEVPKRTVGCFNQHLGIKKSFQYPALDFCRRFFYDVGILKSRRHLK